MLKGGQAGCYETLKDVSGSGWLALGAAAVPMLSSWWDGR